MPEAVETRLKNLVTVEQVKVPLTPRKTVFMNGVLTEPKQTRQNHNESNTTRR